MSIDCDVLVVGAGISGLVTAHVLQTRGLHVRALEAASRPGGVIGTRERDGALYELGPNSTLDTTPLIDTLLDALRIRDQRVDASALAATRFVVRDGAPVPLPMSPGALLRTRVFSLPAKLRLMREPFIARAAPGHEESIAAFVRRRLGQELLDYAIDPFVAGVYAGNPDEISVAAAFPRLHALEQRYGSLIKGQIQGRRERARSVEKARNTAGSFSFARGMQTLPDALGAALRDLTLDASAQAVTHAPGRIGVTYAHANGRSVLTARAVVLATPADVAARLIEPHAPGAAAALDAIAYAAVTAVASLYRRADVRHRLDGFGFLVPRVEHRRILGSLFSSSMFPNRAPQGCVLLTTFVGGRRDPGMAARGPDEVAQVVTEELASLLGATRPPLWQEVVRWPRAIPQYALGHLQRVQAVADAESRLPGIFFCASYRGGVSVGDCIKSAFGTAERVGEMLAAS